MWKILLAIVGIISLLIGALILDHFVLRPPHIAGFEPYIGTWVGEGVELHISETGYVSYARETENTSTSIKAPMQSFSETAFTTGLSIFSTTFEITEPLASESYGDTIAIDGRKLTRFPDAGETAMPSDDEIITLISNSLQAFNAAVAAGNFTEFYENESAIIWKQQISAEEFKNAFALFLEDQETYQQYIGNMLYNAEDIVINAPPVFGQFNELTVTGYVVGSPNQNFELRYIYEHPNWKLFGIKISFGT